MGIRVFMKKIRNVVRMGVMVSYYVLLLLLLFVIKYMNVFAD